MNTYLKQPGTALAVARNGEIIYSKYFRARLDTQFRIASLTKPFTAMATMLLAQEKKLTFDAPLANFFDSLPAWSNTITIKNLLTHTSGISDYESILYKTFKMNKPPQMQDALSVLSEQKFPLFKPGSRQQYSESGYVLLALIIEKLTSSYSGYLNRKIFQPLGMKNTILYDITLPEIKNRAYGYRKTPTGYKLYDNDLLNFIVGNEGIYSTVEDMSRWSRAWYSNILVGPDLLSQALSVNFERGFSWKLNTLANSPIIYHGGSWVGFRCFMAIIPSKKLSTVFLSNSTDFDSESSRKSVVLGSLQKYL